MKILTISKNETSDMIGAYHISITMQQMILVNSVDSIIDTGKVKDASYSKGANIGEVNSNKLNDDKISNLKKVSQNLMKLVE